MADKPDSKNRENQSALPNTASKQPGVGIASLDYIEAVKVAVEQNQHLKLKHSNIKAILIGSIIYEGQNIPCVNIHLNDKNVESIPFRVPSSRSKGLTTWIPVQIFTNSEHESE